MLDGAVAAFLEDVDERGFDEPFLALLRAEGFERVRLTHGSAEFGKDVIAQRDGIQWAWQSKKGNVGQGEFRQMTGQLDELRLSNLAHPDFDTQLPRRAVLVTTGRLSGNAPLSMREYNQRATQTGQIQLEHWDKDILIARIAGNPDSVLRGSVDGQLYSVLGGIENGEVVMDDLERFSQRWSLWDPTRLAGLGLIECALVCDRLRRAERLDLACYLAVCAVRGAAAATIDAANQEAVDAAARLFQNYGRLLWERCEDSLLDRDTGLEELGGSSAWITYPLRCVTLAEWVALYGLSVADDQPETAQEIAQWLARFVAAQPGAGRPIGDRYAVSLVPVAVLLHRCGHEEAVTQLLRDSAVWTCDRYEMGMLGLASHSAEPSEEIARLLGAPFESVELTRRRSSHLAAILLDLCATLGLSDLYPDVRNDLRAVNAFPAVLTAEAPVDRYLRSAPSLRWDHNPDYADQLDGHDPPAPHLAQIDEELAERGDAWTLLATSAALRDRHFPDAIRLLAAA